MAERTVSTLVYKLVADEKDLVESLDKAEKKVAVTAKKFTDAGKALSLGLTAPILAVGAASVKLAAELQDSQNAVQVIFKEGASIIEDYGKTAAETAGLSVQSFNEVSSSIGVLLKQTGAPLQDVAKDTVTLTQRAADLASLLGGTTKDAALALGAALRGESEPARRFGVILSDNAVKAKAAALGIEALGGELTEAQKVQVRYQLILEQSAQAQGDFAKTSDGAKNSAEVLKANIANLSGELGTQLLPIVEDVLMGLRDFIKGFNDLDDGGKRTVIALAAVAAGIGPLLIGLGKTVTAIGTLKTAISELKASEAAGGLAKILASLGPVVTNPVTLGIAATGAAVLALGAAAKSAATSQEKLNEALIGRASFEETQTALAKVRQQIDAMTRSSLQYGEAALAPLKEQERTLSAIVTGYMRTANEQKKAAAEAVRLAEAEAKKAAAEAEAARLAAIAAEKKAKNDADAKKAATDAEAAAKKAQEAADAYSAVLQANQDRVTALTVTEQERYNANIQSEQEWATKLLEQEESRAQTAQEKYDLRIQLIEQERSIAIANAIAEGQEIANIEAYYNGLILTEEQKLADAKTLLADKEKAEIEETKKKRIEAATAAWDAITKLVDTYFQFEQESIEQSGEDEKAKQRKTAELKRKQAIFDKAQALVDIGVNTAVAITKALAILPPFGTILAGAIGVAGAAQAALVASRPLPPLPSFAQGVSNYMVPPGYPNDSFPIMVQSGERVTVETPQQQVNGQSDKTVFQIGTVIADPAGLRELDRLLKKYGTIESMRRG